MVYRYQEWKDGLHNFNDHVILTLRFCLYLRNCFQNHMSVSRTINTLEGLCNQKFPSHDVVLKAYCQFEALCDTEYTYSCVICGFYPAVVVMDRHRKRVFSFDCSKLKPPEADFNGEHDVEMFWECVHLDLVSRGFFDDSSQNPFLVEPSFNNWAAWIGRNTRKSCYVLNTAHEEKVPRQNEDDEVCSVTEECLIDELKRQKVSNLRILCKSCDLDTKGSRTDLCSRLLDAVKSKQTHEKVVQFIQDALGSWSVITCPHGITYSIKFNLRQESPRDFADLLLSWEHIPNVCIYESASTLASHANQRVPDNPPFQPHKGRLAEPTEENIKAAIHQKLRVHLPWLGEKLQNPEENGHPVTGSSHHYMLCNKLHESVTADPKDELRRADLVPELQGCLSSRPVEQLFGALRKNNYFMNKMEPSTHIFLMRNIIEQKNSTLNKHLLKCGL
ncbi:HMG domain-containing protein 3-like isoform 2-T2 [Pholidichthys leucotaenia]